MSFEVSDLAALLVAKGTLLQADVDGIAAVVNYSSVPGSFTVSSLTVTATTSTRGTSSFSIAMGDGNSVVVYVTYNQAVAAAASIAGLYVTIQNLCAAAIANYTGGSYSGLGGPAKGGGGATGGHNFNVHGL
jgi:hypothetical protein